MRFQFANRQSWALVLILMTSVFLAAVQPTTRDGPAPPDEGTSKGWKLCKELPGYARLRERFEIEDSTLGYVNRADLSLFVRLRSIGEGGLNAAWWWDPIADGSPRYSWTDFLDCFDRANEVIKRHSWLKEWIETGPARTLDLHAFGCTTGSVEFDLNHFVRPLWHDAVLSGEPTFEVLARRGNASWAKIFLNSNEPRALIEYTMGADPKAMHWLDRLEVEFHPRCQTEGKNARYATVSPNGELEMRRFSACEP
jgi:hypothetical protein